MLQAAELPGGITGPLLTLCLLRFLPPPNPASSTSPKMPSLPINYTQSPVPDLLLRKLICDDASKSREIGDESGHNAEWAIMYGLFYRKGKKKDIIWNTFQYY